MIKYIKKILVILLVVNSHCKDLTNETLYLGLCTEFWDLDKATIPNDQYKFYRDYIAKTSGPILEPMCGTGRFIIPYVEEGFDVEGFDASPHMFNELRKKCVAKNISPRIWEQYLEDVPETKKYKLIFIPDTSFTIFTDTFHIKNALQKLYRLLMPGGKLVFDVQTIKARWGDIGVWTGKAYKKPDGNIIIESSLPLPIQNSISPLILKYELMDKTGILKTETEYYQAKLYHPTEMDDLLKEAGFKKIKRIKRYNRKASSSLQDLDETIIYECTK